MAFWNKPKPEEPPKKEVALHEEPDLFFENTAEMDAVEYDDDDDEEAAEAGEDEKTQLLLGPRPSMPSMPAVRRTPSAPPSPVDDEDDDKTDMIGKGMARPGPSRPQAPLRPSMHVPSITSSRLPTMRPAGQAFSFGTDADELEMTKPASVKKGLGDVKSPVARPDLPSEEDEWAFEETHPRTAAAPLRAPSAPAPRTPPRRDGSDAAGMDASPRARGMESGGQPTPNVTVRRAIPMDAVPDAVPDDGSSSKARDIELVVFDVDGTLTDGGLYYGPEGEEMKRFCAQDGHGIVLARRAGIEIAILTARTSRIVETRAKELGIDLVFQGRKDKLAGIQEILSATGAREECVAYMGDDLNDLCAMERVGLSACPADACADILERVDFVAGAKGGQGAARKLLEMILKTQGKWECLVDAAREGR